MGVDYEEMGKNGRGRDGMAETIEKVGGRETDLVPYLPVTPTSVLVLAFGGRGNVGEGKNGLLFVRLVMVAICVSRLDWDRVGLFDRLM